MKKLSQGIANWLCRCKELSEFSAEIQYAVHQILWDLSTLILSLICLQLIYSDIQSGLLFAALFLPLHCVAGGAHAQTRLNCVGITILMFIICAYYCHEDTMPFITILSMLSWLFIWKFASTAAQNHIMTIRQKKKNRKLTHHILLLYLLLTILSQKMNIIAVVNSIQISLIIIAILMFACSAYDSDWPHFSQHSWKKQLPQAVLGLCLLICHNAVNMTSYHWEYQDELSDDLRRKFDNI